MKKLFIFALISFLPLFFTGCGYTVSGSTLASHIHTIHVENFKNQITFGAEGRRNIYFPLVELKARNAVIDRFLFDGNLKISEADTADLILKGTLTRYFRRGLRFSDDEDTEEYRVYVVMSLELLNASGEVVWSEPDFSGDATYFVSGSQATSEESAVEAAIEDLARRIVERTIEDW